VSNLNGQSPLDQIRSSESYQLTVSKAAARLVLKDDASDLNRDWQSAAVERSPASLLKDLLAEPAEQQTWRVEGLWPGQGRVVCAAARKAGKTTLTSNLVRSLADSEPFLGHYGVHPPRGRVGLIDTEMSRDMIRRWYGDQQLRRPDRVAVWTLRGRLGSLDVLSREGRLRWAELLKEAEVEVLILDCLAPLLSALELDESNEGIGRFLEAWDALLVEAEVSESLVNHHMGHTSERSRGGSRLRDWPEVEWRLVREREEKTDQEIDGGARFFSAYGRDVEVGETLLEFQPGLRRLVWRSGGRSSHRQVKKLVGVVGAVQELENRQLAATTNAITNASRMSKTTVTQALPEAVDLCYLVVEQVGQANVYSLTSHGMEFMKGNDGAQPVS
jgi:AAA domain-containing protein